MKKLIVFGLVLLLFASFGLAAQSNVDNDATYWHTADNTVVDLMGNHDIEEPIITSTFSTDYAKVGSHGMFHNSGQVNLTDDADLTIGDNDFTIGMWVNVTTEADFALMWHGSATTYFRFYNWIPGDQTLALHGANPAINVNWVYDLYDSNVNEWASVIAVRIDGKCYMYIDGVSLGASNNQTADCHVTLGDYGVGWAIGNRPGSSVGSLSAGWDEAFFYNGYGFVQEDVDIVYNGGAGYQPDPGGGEVSGNSMNVSVPYPSNDTQFNSQSLNFNLSANSTYQFNCSLYINDTLNQTNNEYSLGEYIGVDFNVTFEAAAEANYDFIIGCWNGYNDTNSSRHLFYIDNVDPVLSVDTTLSSNRLISYRTSNISSSVNLTDDNLWGLNITIDNTTIVFNVTDITGSTYSYDLSFDPTDYSLTTGEHTLNFWVSDSHTANIIPDYYFEKNPLSKSITYKFDEGWIKVNPTNTGLFSGFDTWKNKDRYVFEFERDLIGKILYGTDLEFEITSSHNLDQVDSEFPGHIISPDLEKWIDFDSQYKDAVITTTRINSRTFRVLIEGIEDDVILFNSLGGLNVIEEDYTFYYGNFTETYVADALESELTEFSVNFTINDSYVEDIDAVLNWDGTYYAASTKTTSYDSIYFERSITSGLLSSGNQINKSFFWNYTITNAGAGNDINNDTTDATNQSVYKMIVSNCTNSIATTTAINYSVLDVIFGTPAWVVSEASFTIWNGSSSITRDYGLVWDNSTSFNVCIWPAWATFYTDYVLLYTGYGDTNSRIRTNDTLDNTTEYVTLYLATEGDDISINVVDENDDAIEDLNVEAWLYSISEDNYSLVSEESTDPDGLAVMRLYTAGEDEYKFLIYDGTTLLHTSSKFKIYQTSYTFRIVLGTIPNSTLLALQNLDYDLSIDKVGENFTLTWNDVPTGLISKINLTVVRSNATANTVLNSQTSTASSGTLSYNVTGGYGTYIAYAYITASGDGSIHLLDSVSLDLREEWEIFGTDALLMSLFFIGTMAFTGLAFSPHIALVASIFGMIVFFALGFIQVGLAGVVSIIVSMVIILVRLKK